VGQLGPGGTFEASPQQDPVVVVVGMTLGNLSVRLPVHSSSGVVDASWFDSFEDLLPVCVGVTAVAAAVLASLVAVQKVDSLVAVVVVGEEVRLVLEKSVEEPSSAAGMMKDEATAWNQEDLALALVVAAVVVKQGHGQPFEEACCKGHLGAAAAVA